MKIIEGLSIEEERAALLFRALGNPARIRIVRELAKQSSCLTTDLADVLPLAQSTISEHLKVLKDAGIVRGSIDGDRCYCLDPGTIDWLQRFCSQLPLEGPIRCDPSDGCC